MDYLTAAYLGVRVSVHTEFYLPTILDISPVRAGSR